GAGNHRIPASCARGGEGLGPQCPPTGGEEATEGLGHTLIGPDLRALVHGLGPFGRGGRVITCLAVSSAGGKTTYSIGLGSATRARAPGRSCFIESRSCP